MSVQSLIIDCDPGVDDAVALMLAFASSALEVLAVTTVAGNAGVHQTSRNARMLRAISGRDDVPVFVGADRPLVRDATGAGEFHGPEGLGDLAPFEPTAPPAEGHAADAIVDLVMARPERSVALAVMGPMTNVALALRRQPRLAARLGSVVVMGGARSEGGNITPSAEYNIWADPDAAAEVFASACEMVVLGLDATHQVRATEDRIAAVAAIGTSSSDTAAAMLRFSQRIERNQVGRSSPPGWGAPLHDPCTIAYLLQPDLFETRPCRIEVETASDLTRGHTAVEFRVDPMTARHRWATKADGPGVFDLIVRTLGDAR